MLPYIKITDKVHIPTYGLVFLIGVAIAYLIGRRTTKKVGIEKHDLLYATVYAGIGILIGSKVLYFISRISIVINGFEVVKKAFSENWWYTLTYLGNMLFGGFVFYGGLIGSIVGIYIYCKKYKIDFLSMMDVYAPLVPFAHAFGRIACFLAGCCYGIEYHGPLAVEFPYNEFSEHLNEVPRFPVQLLETTLNFIVFAALYTLYCKGKMYRGKLLGLYLVYYSIARFFLEFLRADLDRGGIGAVSTSQIISILILPVGIWLIFNKRLTNKNRPTD